MNTIQARKQFQVRAGNKILSLGEKTAIMGILNVTPDSFSDSGRYLAPEVAVERAWKIAEEAFTALDTLYHFDDRLKIHLGLDCYRYCGIMGA